ncbi:MAG: zinc finger-like domain-containing protein [Sandaracinus sp.]
MLAAPPPLSDRDEVLALLRALHAESPSTRRDPASLRIRAIVATPVHRIAITRVAENRGLRVQPRMPAPRRPPTPQALVDAWQMPELDLPEGSPIGQRAEKLLDHLPERVSDCERCRGAGKVTCTLCNGAGVRGHGQHRHVCAACSGHGSTECVPCHGMGGFAGPPIAWSAIVEGTATRIVRAPGISDEAALDVDAVLAKGRGAVVVRDDAWSGGFDTSLGYRDSGSATQLGDEVRALLAELEQTTMGRVRGHKLEIRRAAVYTVTLEDGTSFVVWGTPAKVAPEGALDVRGAEIRRVLGLLLVGVVIALVVIWLGHHR